MGNRSAEILKIWMMILAVIAVITVSFMFFTISKRTAFNNQTELITQIQEVSDSEYISLNQSDVTGVTVKQVYNTLKDKGSILILTKSFIGVQTGFNDNLDKQEAEFNGQAKIDAELNTLPATVLENFSVKTYGGTLVENPIAVNYGCILKNSISEIFDGDNIKSNFTNSSSKLFFNWNSYDETVDYSQSLYFKDGIFYTKLDYASNLVNSRVLFYNLSTDFNLKGKTMFISDKDMFKSYVIKNSAGSYVGVVFVQQ